MSLVLDTKEARKADNQGGSIRESGKYIGIITRAEKLLSKNNVEGFGLSFKTDDGLTANYLDIYTMKPNGEKLRGLGFVQAILCCTKTKEAKEGEITFDRYDKEAKEVIKAKATGYPELMGKRIGLLLQKELSTNDNTGADVERVNVYAVFEADTEFTASEMLDQKTQPEQLEKMVRALMNSPVRDTRKDFAKGSSQSSNSDSDKTLDDVPW